eukprot:CAMPEP_0113857270 /NCGR_PEP_ID=MMETSP0372-20130328/10016_1 /TAXON_ID=340204 /ORGANISM="Lankesteria abbotti" /LENGTH=57 /DNA_ID=CAMNT_0000832999 /DNA_START=41 /DNA_END=210 /DNA_ORIENTATION=- /assembly_acc=CAM_ASM_000359
MAPEKCPREMKYDRILHFNTSGFAKVSSVLLTKNSMAIDFDGIMHINKIMEYEKHIA